MNTINVIELKQLLDQTPQNVMLIDVREQVEFTTGHIQGAINVPLSLFLAEFHRLHLHQQHAISQQIVLYCAAGMRSALAWQQINNLGISMSNIYNFEGSMNAWIAAGYDISR